MAVDFDKELTSLTAEILRDAVQVYDTSDIERWAAGLAGFGAGDVTGSFQAVTGGFTAVTGSFRAVTGSFPSLTGQFAVVGQDADTQITLKKVFRLPDRLPAVRLPQSADLARLARSAPMMAKLNALAGWSTRTRICPRTTRPMPPASSGSARSTWHTCGTTRSRPAGSIWPTSRTAGPGP